MTRGRKLASIVLGIIAVTGVVVTVVVEATHNWVVPPSTLPAPMNLVAEIALSVAAVAAVIWLIVVEI